MNGTHKCAVPVLAVTVRTPIAGNKTIGYTPHHRLRRSLTALMAMRSRLSSEARLQFRRSPGNT